MDEGRFSISERELYRRLGSGGAPLVADVRPLLQPIWVMVK